MIKRIFTVLKKPLLSALLSVAVVALILVVAGYDASNGFYALFSATFGKLKGFCGTLNKSTPLMLCALAFAVGSKGSIMNMGMDGQLLIGGVLATAIGISAGDLPFYILMPMVCIAGALGGALWSLIPGLLRSRFRISEIITTIMFNYIASGLVAYLCSGPMKSPDTSQNISRYVSENAQFPYLIEGTRLHIGFFLGSAAAILVYILLYKTRFGFEMRAVGLNKVAAKANGIGTERTMLTTMLLSGAIAGLAGAVEIMGTTHYMIETLTDSFGFTGIAVSILVSNNPIGIIFSSFIFGMLRTGATAMQRLADISSSFVSVFEGMIIIFIAVATVKDAPGAKAAVKRSGAEKSGAVPLEKKEAAI
jgi:simple sugar transport system permease protein